METFEEQLKRVEGYYSGQMQDLWVEMLLGKNKTFLDIGSGHPKDNNNTYLLEKNGWEGICVDIDDHLPEYKKERISKFFQVDSTTKEFINLLEENYSNKLIDYISLDVDEHGLATLENLLNHDYDFKSMTFEHDLYRRRERGDTLKIESTAILLKRGYFPLFENVCLEELTLKEGEVSFQVEGDREGLGVNPLEDWWINPRYVHGGFCNVAARGLFYVRCLQRMGALATKTLIRKGINKEMGWEDESEEFLVLDLDRRNEWKALYDDSYD